MPFRHCLLLVLAGLIGACKNDDPLRVDTEIHSPVTLQGERLSLSVRGFPPDEDRVTALIIEVTGAIGIYDSVPITETGSVHLDREYIIPVGNPNGSGTVVGRGRTRDGKVASQTRTYEVNDHTPPHFILSTFPAIVHPGDTLLGFFEVVDDVRVKYAFLRFSGAWSREDSLFVGAPGYLYQKAFPIPDTVAQGSSIVVSAFAVDYVGNTADSVLMTIPYMAP